MIEASRFGVREAIEADITAFSNDTLWGPKPNKNVIHLGRKFCDETLENVNAINDMNVIQHLAFFSKVVLVLVASTRYYEEIDEEELNAISKILDDIRALRADIINGDRFESIYLCTMYVRDIINTNTNYREDYESKYRQCMIFPSFVDLYDIVHKIIGNWDKLNEVEDFATLYSTFKKDWLRLEIGTDHKITCEIIPGEPRKKTETAKQDEDPGFWARKFITMLDERVNS